MDTQGPQGSSDPAAWPAPVTRRSILKGGVALVVRLAVGASAFEAWHSVPVARGQDTVWLHVHVDKRTEEGQQVSTAYAWTTSDEAGTNRVVVTTLHLVLDAFRHQADQCTRCHYLRVEEVHLGSGVTTATATAWCEGPTIGPVTKSV